MKYLTKENNHKFQPFAYSETFARKMISLSGQAKTHGMREFMLINDRLSTILTQYAGEMAFVQRSHSITLAVILFALSYLLTRTLFHFNMQMQ